MECKMPPPYRDGAICRGSTLLTALTVVQSVADRLTDSQIAVAQIPCPDQDSGRRANGRTRGGLVPRESRDAQRCARHFACRHTPRPSRDFSPRLKGALQKHLPGNACTR